MPDDRLGTAARAAAAAAAAPPPAPGLLERFAQTARDARRLVYDHLELAALEAQRAADGFVRVLVGSVVVAILVVSAWMAVVAAVAVWATNAGLSLPWALVLVAVANVVVAAGLFFWMRKQFPELLFTATLRQLRETAGKDPDDEDESDARQP